MKTIIVQRTKDGKQADIKLTLEDASPENVTRVLEFVRKVEAGEI
jgi:hypothetical protein